MSLVPSVKEERRVSVTDVAKSHIPTPGIFHPDEGAVMMSWWPSSEKKMFKKIYILVQPHRLVPNNKSLICKGFNQILKKSKIFNKTRI